MGNKWAERHHPDLAGKLSLMKFELGHWKPSNEGYVVEMRDPGQGIAISAKAEPIKFTHPGRTSGYTLVGTIQYPGVEQPAVLFRLDREMAVTIKLVDSRPVTNTP